MKNILAFFICLFSLKLAAQKANFAVNNISLPSEISYYDNQFSGLFIQNDKLFFLSESRLQDKAEAKLYSIQLKDINKKLKDTSFTLPFKKIPIYNLDILRDRMYANGDEYEGLEAIVIDKKNIYLSVETATTSNNCYLLKGTINDTAIVLDKNIFTPILKPVGSDGKHIYNAGFEALANCKKSILTFFEFNYFPQSNVINKIGYRFNKQNKSAYLLSQKLPFRLTDITAIGKRNFTAINYFYNGGGEDEVYRIPSTDSTNYSLIKDSNSYKSYARLVSIKYKNKKFNWLPLWEFPESLWSYNWEGIAAYKKGYFVINDKYTALKPYKSVLLYLAFTK